MAKYLKVATDGVVTSFLECSEEAAGNVPIPQGERLVQFDYGLIDHARRWRFDGMAIHDAGAMFGPGYSDMRRASYPTVGEQLDSLWHAMNDGTLPKAEPFFSSIQSVKLQYPKPSN